MPFHLGPRLHALTHTVFKSRDQTETARLFNEVIELFVRVGVTNADERNKVIRAIAICISEDLNIDTQTPLARQIETLTRELVDYENIWRVPDIDWSQKRETSEWWQLREELNRQRALLKDFDTTFDLIADALTAMLRPFVKNQPQTDVGDEYVVAVETPLLNRVERLSEALEGVLCVPANEGLVDANLFTRLRGQLERNLFVASGGELDDPRSRPRKLVSPEKSTIKDPSTLVEEYLGATPFSDFLTQPARFTIPSKTRFEHAHVIAGTGHGKSQTLQYLIAQDLPAVAAGERSVVVIDSQGDLIKNILKLKEFAPGGALHDRLVLIDPTDVEYPVSLNLFDVGRERLESYEALERERLTNSILELYDFVLGSLLDAAMTQKQNVIFRYVTRLMLHIEDATIHTLRELMERGSEEVFADDIAKLTGTARKFFETEFGDGEFTATRKQVLRRLWGILENQTFERMFSHPRSKLDLYEEMNAGKVILINTAKDLLKEQGTQIFGRFFIAMIAQAAQERAVLPPNKRFPTLVYVVEAAVYFDRNIGVILSLAR